MSIHQLTVRCAQRLQRRRLRMRPLLPNLEAQLCRQRARIGAIEDGESLRKFAEEHQQVVRQRLHSLLTPRDVDLLYLRFVAEWSQAEVARERGVHRATIQRQEQHLLSRLRADPLLRWLVRLPPFPPEAMQQRALTCEDHNSSLFAAGWNVAYRGIERRRVAA